MAGRSDDYPNTKVGIEQGAERLFVDEDGFFNFYNSDVTGKQMKAQIYAATQQTIIINSAGVLSTVNVPSNHGLVVYSIANAASDASAWMTSCLKGQKMTLMIRGAGTSGSVFISTLSGVTMIGHNSGEISSIAMNIIAGSHAFVNLLATDDDEWSVQEIAATRVALNALA